MQLEFLFCNRRMRLLLHIRRLQNKNSKSFIKTLQKASASPFVESVTKPRRLPGCWAYIVLKNEIINRKKINLRSGVDEDSIKTTISKNFGWKYNSSVVKFIHLIFTGYYYQFDLIQNSNECSPSKFLKEPFNKTSIIFFHLNLFDSLTYHF